VLLALCVSATGVAGSGNARALSQRFAASGALALGRPSTVAGWVYALRDGAACKVGEALIVKSRAESPVRLERATIGSSLTVRSDTRWSVVEVPVGSDSVIAASFHLPLVHGRLLGRLRNLTLPPSRRSMHWYAIVARLKVTVPMHSAWQISAIDVRYRLNGLTHEASFPEDVRVAAANRCRS
jgi:hypothetical protein